MTGAVIGWRAWYAGGRTFSSDETDWTDLPDDGVLGAMVYYADRSPGGVPYRRIVSGGDWYHLVDGEPACTATHDEWGEWVDPPDAPDAELKRGRGVHDEEFEAVHAEMLESRWRQ